MPNRLDAGALLASLSGRCQAPFSAFSRCHARGWEVVEREGVPPVYCGDNGREDALSYARQRAGYGPTEIRVLDAAWNVVETIGNEDTRPWV